MHLYSIISLSYRIRCPMSMRRSHPLVCNSAIFAEILDDNSWNVMTRNYCYLSHPVITLFTYKRFFSWTVPRIGVHFFTKIEGISHQAAAHAWAHSGRSGGVCISLPSAFNHAMFREVTVLTISIILVFELSFFSRFYTLIERVTATSSRCFLNVKQRLSFN